MKNRRTILIIVRDHRRRVFLVLGRVNRARWKPCSLSNPDMIELPRLRDREDSKRYAAVEGFVDSSEVESHWDGRSFVGTSIKKFPVHHDGDGSKPRLAFGRQLHESQGTRTLVNCGFMSILRKCLGCQPRTSQPGHYQASHCHANRRQGDGEHPVAI